jgi:hypothetical protein
MFDVIQIEWICIGKQNMISFLEVLVYRAFEHEANISELNLSWNSLPVLLVESLFPVD